MTRTTTMIAIGALVIVLAILIHRNHCAGSGYLGSFAGGQPICGYNEKPLSLFDPKPWPAPESWQK
jgi:hypothetical protein